MKYDREKTLGALKVGDTAILRDLNFPAKRVTITKVGRTLLHANGRTFDLKTGRNKDGMSWLVSVEEHEYSNRVEDARKKLQGFGVDIRGNDPEKVLTVYEALKSIIG